MNVLWYFCCYLVMSKWLPLPLLVTYMAIEVCFCLRAWKAILCVGTKAGLLLLCLFCSCPLSLWKMRLFSTATPEMPVVLWLCQGIKVGSCFSADAIHSNPVTGGECPFNCAMTFPSLLGSSSAFQRHPCLVFLCPASNCSWYLLCLLDDKPIKNIWNMAVCYNSALCSALFCWNFAGTPSGCSGALLLRMFCLLGWSDWLWPVLSGLPLDLEALKWPSVYL